MELSVVIPVHDEADNICPLLAEVVLALRERGDYEIIVVDDGSADTTPEVLTTARRELPQLRVVRHALRAGQSAALVTGVRHARGRVIATLDGDGQNDPADLPGLLRLLSSDEGGVGLVTGHRVARHDSALQRFSSRVANSIRSWVLRDGTRDTGCGLKVFRRETFMALPVFDHMHRFLPALVLRQGGRVRSVPVHHRPRTRGRSHYGVHNRLWVGLVDLAGVAWLQRRMPRVQAVEENSNLEPSS
jgi:dolichol-phosphate mannosyltransferase